MMLKRLRTMILASLLIGAFIGMPVGLAQGTRSVTLSWDANSEPDLHHYVVYFGTESRNYSQDTGDIGLATTYTLVLPDDKKVYYFAVTAVDEAGLESDYSNEVNTEGPKPPGILKIKVVVDVSVNVDTN